MFTTEDVVALTRLIYYTLYCSLNGQYRVEGQENVITQAQDFLRITQKNKIKILRLLHSGQICHLKGVRNCKTLCACLCFFLFMLCA